MEKRCTTELTFNLAIFLLLYFLGNEIQLELTIVGQNGVEVVYQPEYQDLTNGPTKEFVKALEKEVRVMAYLHA